MASAPVPFAPEASEAPHRHARVPPTVDQPAQTTVAADSADDPSPPQHADTPLPKRRESLSSSDTLHSNSGEAAGACRFGGEENLEKGAKAGGQDGVAGDTPDGPGKESIVVDWKGNDDPACPLNWSFRRRMAATICVALFTLLAPLSSSMIAPAAPQVAAKLHITDEVEISMSVSIFVLAFAISPLVFGPASELYGRVRVLQLANVFYLVWNLVCAFATTRGQFIAFRFLAGFGGGAPLSIGAGVLSDLWRPEERGKGAALYSLGPLLGPAMGPVMGGWIAEKLPNNGYKVVFYATTGFSALVQLVGLFFLTETYAPVLLRRQALTMKKDMGLPADSEEVRTIFEVKAGRKTPKEVIQHGMLRPFSLFLREPILQILSLFMSIIYGVIYILIVSTTDVFQQTYGESTGIAGTNFVALMLGFFLASQVVARLLDVMYRKLKARENGKGRPEFRLPMMMPASIILPVGLLLYGWAAEKRIHWIVPDIGLFLVGLSMISIFQAISSYLLDAFTLYAASALAAATCLRSICGFAFPLFAPYMYNGIGYGWGCTVLALVSIVVGVPAAPVLYVYGERIRKQSRFAAKGQA
ncbi:hypothetical protein JCM10213_003735 [Rhodosporidiobolus nylandii]